MKYKYCTKVFDTEAYPNAGRAQIHIDALTTFIIDHNTRTTASGKEDDIDANIRENRITDSTRNLFHSTRLLLI